MSRGTLLFDHSPHLREEWDYEKNGDLDPNHLSYGLATKVWWKCSLGHSYERTLNSRTNRGSGCSYCTGRKVLEGFNDLSTTHPELSSELFDPRDATMITSGSKKRLRWNCGKDHQWEASVSDRVRGYGCTHCRGLTVLIGFNDLETTHPEIARQIVDSSLKNTLTKGTPRKIEWRCDNSHIFTASVNSRTNQGSGCPYCSNRLVLVGYNDLATTHPHLLAEWDDPKDPSTVTYGHYSKVRWKCSLGHTWESAPARRVRYGCPYCSGNLTTVGVNDLRTKYPDIAMELVDNSLATQVSYGSNLKVDWKCVDGHIWTATVSSRTNMKSGCPKCCTTRTSKIEQRLCGLLGDDLNVVGSGADHKLPIVWRNRPNTYVDIELTHRGRHIIVEYDGKYFHSTTEEKDAEKTQLLLSHGYCVVRVRENELPHLDISHHNLLQLSVKYSLKDDYLIEAVHSIKDWLTMKDVNQ